MSIPTAKFICDNYKEIHIQDLNGDIFKAKIIWPWIDRIEILYMVINNLPCNKTQGFLTLDQIHDNFDLIKLVPREI